MIDLRQHLRYVNESIDDLEYRKKRLERTLLRTTLELESKRRFRAEIEREMKKEK